MIVPRKAFIVQHHETDDAQAKQSACACGRQPCPLLFCRDGQLSLDGFVE